MIAAARVAAFDVLEAVSSGRVDLPAALAHARERLTDPRDRALCSDIAAGVERHRSTIDHLIAAFARRPIERLDSEVVTILRLSVYQLLHLTRVPASAVVDDAVDLTRRARKRSASGFVNAVLRSLSRSRRALPLPARPSDPSDRDAALDYLSTTLSHPRWLAARWYGRIGFEAAERWLRFDNEPAPLTLRVNRLKTTRDALVARLAAEDVRVSPGRFAPDALVVDSGDSGDSGGGQPLQGGSWAEGWFVVQDEASQLIATLAGPSPGLSVLDTCASPGGKTVALAAAMANRGLLVACDVRDKRVALLRRTVAACGASNIRIVQADATTTLPFTAQFDCVLVDAPCSGLGTLRRDPDIRWRRREEDLPALAAAQHQMLRHAADAVAPGGRLIYATCSSEPEENEDVADAFTTGAPDFVPVDARTIPGVPAAVADPRGHLRTAPHLHGLEAFFGAVFERTQS
jgi:16S rRNA (cytosine967-C5)-methyltransferase